MSFAIASIVIYIVNINEAEYFCKTDMNGTEVFDLQDDVILLICTTPKLSENTTIFQHCSGEVFADPSCGKIWLRTADGHSQKDIFLEISVVHIPIACTILILFVIGCDIWKLHKARQRNRHEINTNL